MTAYDDTSDNIYVRNIQAGTTTLIASGDNASAGGLSEDGRFTYYITDHELMLYDALLNTTSRVDVNGSGTGSTGVNTNTYIGTSCDGRYAVFASSASNLVSSDTNGYTDVFLVDSMNGHTIKDITLSGNDESYAPSISCDGNYILFVSYATNLVSGGTSSSLGIFQYNVETGVTKLVDIDPSGTQYGGLTATNGGLNIVGHLSESEDGRYVVFSVDIATEGLGGQTINSGQVFMRDMQSNTTTALTTLGSNTWADWPEITYDGRTAYYGYSSSSYNFYRQIYSATDYL
jgi:hypothetical protein